MQTFCVRYDPNDKYIAAGKSFDITYPEQAVVMVPSESSMSSQENKVMC